MFSTISIIILLLIAVVLVLIARRTKRTATKNADAHNAKAAAMNDRWSGASDQVEAKPFGDKFGYLPAWVAFFPLAIALLWLIFTSYTTVDAKTEGVLLTFKAPSERLLDSGFALKAPWQSVVEVDGTRKTDNFNNGKANAEDDPVQDHGTIACRLGDNGKADVFAAINWSRTDGTSNRVYEQYRSDDPVEEMRESLVVPRFRDAINQVCGEYRPTESIDALNIDFADPQEVSSALQTVELAPNFADLSEKATTIINDLLEPSDGSLPLVTVEKVSISGIDFPKSTEGKIQAFIDEATKTRTALQSQATATATAEANRIISASVSNDPNVLVNRCFDLIADGLLVLPAGGTCWPGGGGSVVIPSAK